MHNKKILKVGDIPKYLSTNLLIADEDNPQGELKDVNMKWGMLIRLGMKEGKIHDCIFRHCIFQDCYFRSVKFRNVNFTGSFFENCNFSRATFEACCFWYARFSKCWLNYDEILQSLPSEANIAISLLQSLRQNAIEMGEGKIADKILLREIIIEKQELKNQFWAQTEYYKKRYNTIERFRSGVKFWGLCISGLICGHGLKLSNLLVSAILGILAFAIFIFKLGSFASSDNGTHVDLSFVESLYISVVTFTTLGCGNFLPTNSGSYAICAIESFVGVVFLGFLVATVYRRFAR